MLHPTLLNPPRPSVLGALIALLIAFASSGAVHAREPLTVVVVLDTSGSMREPGHDPKEISKFAVEVLARFLADDDRLGVVPLGASEAAIPPTRLDELRDRLPKALAAIPYAGGTPCAARLGDARRMLDEAGGAGPRSVVLLTDGVCHQGAGDKDAKDDEARQLARTLQADGVPIFGIPLGAAADVDFVRELSAGAELEWQVQRVEQARQLPALFAALSGALQNTEARSVALPRGDQTLTLDPYLRSVTLLATVDGGAVNLRRITDPVGERAATSPTEGQFPRGERTKKRLSGYSLIKLVAPEPGDWTLQVDAAADPSAVVVYDYDLRAALELTDPSPPKPGATVEVRATLRTPSGDPVEAKFLADAAATLQVRGPSESAWRDAQPMSWDSVAWFTAPVPLTVLGRYRLRARVTRGKSLDLRTYAEVVTTPGLALTAPSGPCLTDGAPIPVTASLLASGDPATLAARGAEFDVRLWVRGPGQADLEPSATLAWNGDERAFKGTFTPPEPGTYSFEARLQGGPGIVAKSSAVTAELVRARVTLGSAPVDLGRLKAGASAAATLPWERVDVSHPLEVTADTTRLTVPEGVRAEVAASPLMPGDSAAAVTLALAMDEGSDGGAVAGVVSVRVTGTCLPPAGLVFEVPVRADVVPLTFWERVGAFWRDHPWIVISLGVLLLLVIYGLLVLLCMRRTHAFGANLAISMAEKNLKFAEPRLVSDYSGTRRRYLVPLRCRSARLYWNVNNDDFGDTRSPTWWLEATRDGGARLVLPDGTTAEAAPSATPSKLAPLETPCALVSDSIYKVGDVFFKIQ